MKPFELLRQIAEIPCGDTARGGELRRAAAQMPPEAAVSALTNDERQIATVAGEVLVAMGTRAVPILAASATGDDEREAILATTVLGRIGSIEADEAVMAVLRESTSTNVLHAAIDAVAQRGLQSAIPVLRVLADRDEWLRIGAMFAIEMIEAAFPETPAAAGGTRHEDSTKAAP